MGIRWLLSVALVACASGRTQEKHVQPGTDEQPFAEAVAKLCDAPTRAESDPDWPKAKEPAQKAMLLGKYLSVGVTHPRALRVANAADETKVGDLDAIVAESGIQSCRLQQVWTAPANEPAVVPADALK